MHDPDGSADLSQPAGRIWIGIRPRPPVSEASLEQEKSMMQDQLFVLAFFILLLVLSDCRYLCALSCACPPGRHHRPHEQWSLPESGP